MKIALRDVAAVIRSKNAGPFELTLDVLLKEKEMFDKIREADVISIVYFPNAKAVKATIVRPLASGALGERDVYGAQQHAPLMNFVFEL